MEQIYCGNFIFTKKGLRSGSEKVIKVEEFSNLDLSATSVFVGDGCELIKEQLEELDATVYKRYPDAKDLLIEAQKKFNEGTTIDPKDLIPVYLSGEDHWVKS